MICITSTAFHTGSAFPVFILPTWPLAALEARFGGSCFIPDTLQDRKAFSGEKMARQVVSDLECIIQKCSGASLSLPMA